tara:strand:- start:360 stop:605 length:246 start_codon:yes stop_codon:yes gene_type:complete
MIEVLKFSATWCGPCKMLSKVLENVEGITNVDIDTEMEIARENKVRSVPTIVFKKDGKEEHRQVGLMSKSQYDEILNKLSN